MRAMLPNSTIDVEELIQKCFPALKDRRVLDVVDVGWNELEDNKSFWSQIIKLQLQWKNDELKEQYPNSLFIKFSQIQLPHLSSNLAESETRELSETLADFTHYEVEFYKTLRNVPIPNFPTPLYYYGEDMSGAKGGLLVVEDLSHLAVSTNFVPGFSVEQVNCLMDALAGWHYHVITADVKWTDQYDRNVDLDQDFENEQFKCAMRLEEIRPEWFKGKIEGLRKNFTVEESLDANLSHNKLDIPAVLCHADLNVTNVLWNKATSSKECPELLAIIDFQQTHTGNICEDITRLTMLAVSADVRRQHAKGWIKRYHDTLSNLFDGNPPYSLEKVQEAHDYIFPFSSKFALFGIFHYYSMYEHLESDPEKRTEYREELLCRARGIVEDLYELDANR